MLAAGYDLWKFVSEYHGELLHGLVNTLKVSALALGFRPLGAFFNVTLPIGGRIALPSSINTAISVVKNTSLMYVIGYMELTTTALNISNLTLQTTEALTVLAIVYLALVWSLSAAIRLLETRLALPEAR